MFGIPENVISSPLVYWEISVGSLFDCLITNVKSVSILTLVVINSSILILSSTYNVFSFTNLSKNALVELS